MREYGAPRLYWEGGFKGEGILRAVKPVVTQGTHMSWFATAALQRYYSDKSMSMLLQNNLTTIDGDDKKMAYGDRKIFTYKNGVEQLATDISSGKPISAAMCKTTGKVVCLIVHEKKKAMLPIILDDAKGEMIGNTYHTPLRLATAEIMDVLPVDHLLTFVMLLPHRDPAQKIHSGFYFYYCVTDNWLERMKQDDGVFILALPKIADAEYNY